MRFRRKNYSFYIANIMVRSWVSTSTNICICRNFTDPPIRNFYQFFFLSIIRGRGSYRGSQTTICCK